MSKHALRDGFGRTISYLRVSVTDRCDLRCVYCMAEDQHFLPKAEVLSLEELDRLCTAFVRRGVRKLRLTGGEPLARKNVRWLFERLARHLESGALEELTLTTNGVLLGAHAAALAALGVKRVNISLDTLDRARFARIARRDKLAAVLAGIAAAKAAGLKVKINTVALKGENEAELPALIQWAHAQGFDLCLIEAMPVGEIGVERADQFVSLARVRQNLESFWRLRDLPDSAPGALAGPARYVRVEETGGRLGFITPLSHTFCETCNRVRVTCTGTLFMCLGQEDAADLRMPLRASADDALLDAAIDRAIAAKPKAHDFVIARQRPAAVSRPMSATGG
ncbi:MAG: GTP 3',8-cyclase MoaA [Hyphomonadaceae bacterium]